MRFSCKILGISIFLVPMSQALLAENVQVTFMDAVTRNVRDVCQAPSDKGKYWDVDIKGNGEAKLILKLTDLGLSGQAEFTKKEWEGVQQVLQEQQLDENKNYRECVQKLTPLFIEKFAPLPPPPPPPSRVTGWITTFGPKEQGGGNFRQFSPAHMCCQHAWGNRYQILSSSRPIVEKHVYLDDCDHRSSGHRSGQMGVLPKDHWGRCIIHSVYDL